MGNPVVRDGADPVDRYIAKLYRSALRVEPGEYRAWALNEWAEVIPHDGALWGSGSRSNLRFHTRTVTGLPETFPAALEASTLINPIVPKLLENLDTPVDMRSVFPDRKFFQSELYHSTFEPFGVSRILATGHLDPRSGLYSLLTIYRSERSHVFTPEEAAKQKRVIYHLFNAASHAFFLHLLRSHTRPQGGGAAVVDGQGMFHEAQPRFLDLLEEHFPQRTPNKLPFTLPPAGEIRMLDNVCVKTEAVGDMSIVWLWPSGPLDRLTSREREIVIAVAQGLSFKQAARKIGVAPSTVANHLYRVYRKLGVYSRTELATLVHPEG